MRMVGVTAMDTTNVVDCSDAQFLKQAMTTGLNKGDTWYVVSKAWLDEYNQFIDGKGTNPGPIDNTNILETDSNGGKRLSSALVEGSDFDTIPEFAWRALKTKFGLKDNSHEMGRHVIESGVIKQTLRLELVPLNVQIKAAGNDENILPLTISRAETLAAFITKSKELLQIPENSNFKMYLQHKDQIELLEFKQANGVLENFLSPNQTIIFDIEDKDGNYVMQQSPGVCNGSVTNGDTASGSNPPKSISPTLGPGAKTLRSGNVYGNEEDPPTSSIYTTTKSYVPGVCGLQNLGNTCFMNSGIQCLSNVPQLTKYFLANRHESEINTKNPLGTGGKLASAYATLLHNMWAGNACSIVPRQFKNVIGDFCPTFSGYSQQDSQELMLSVLDILHEDLNRILNKPYVELREAEGRPDKVVAQEAWENHLKRNDSIVIDLLHGLLKSTLVCPDCERISTKFDPFCFLSVPVPSRPGKILSFYLVPPEPDSKWIKMKVRIPSNARVSEVMEEVRKVRSELHNYQMLLCDTLHGRVARTFRDDDFIAYTEKDYILYVLPKFDHPAVTVVCMQRYEKSLGGFQSCNVNSKTWNTFSLPIVIRVSMDEYNLDNLYAKITERLHPTFCNWPDVEDDKWWEGGENDMDVQEDNFKDDPQVPSVFKLTVVNAFGATTEDKGKQCNMKDHLKEDDSSRPMFWGDSLMYFGIDWHTLAKQKLYLHNYTQEIEEDRSVSMHSSPVTLDDCLELFSKEEQLGKGNEWTCPTCKEGKQASKKMEIWSLPKILIVQLKRFTQARLWRSKIDQFIDFPLNDLNMAQWVINEDHPPALYDLIAISNHMGGLGGGHYTADAFNFVDNHWYHFDDSRCNAESAKDIKSSYAYVLVYKLREPTEMLDLNIEKEEI